MKEFVDSFWNIVSNSENIMITSHTGPDDDSIGSVMAMKQTLEAEEVSADIVYEANKSDRWKPFEFYNRVSFVKSLKDHVEKYDAYIFLDANELSRFSQETERYPGKKICIDHHVLEHETQFDIEHIDSKAASTTTLIHNLFWKEKTVSPNLAESLLLGIMGDTGRFRYVNPDNSDVLRVAEKVIKEGGIRVEKFNSQFNSTKRGAFEVYTLLLHNATVKDIEGWPRFLYSFVDKEDVEDYTDEEISTGAHMFVSWPKRVEGITWGFVYTPRSNDQIACSFRSIPGSVNVQDIAKRMDIGGGHIRAAGGRFKDMTTREAVQQTEEWMEKHEAVTE